MRMRLAVSLGVLALGFGVAAGPLAAADRGEIPPRARARLAGVADTETLRRAVSGAAARLHGRSCRGLLTEFEDGDGRPLADRLSSLGTTADRYLDDLLFVDGGAVATCHRRQVLAVTTPGARVVHVCTAQFVTAALKDPTLAQAIVIHEMLHTLGLGENPPTSRHITSRVLQACAR